MIENLGEFKIKKQLGEGGMGAVYKAYQESLDREVALKVLTEALCKNEKFIARFKREARSAASIVHPNVIQIYSIGEQDGIHYFAMEYVRGQDLNEYLAQGKRFSVEETLDIIVQVAEACACAAEVGIIHRDLKPANIMFTDRKLVKVTDFGLAKTVSSDLDVTEAGTIVGTANYMSPEQGQGKKLDGRSDIYSLGVVFFELLTGRVPFVGDQPSAVLYQHVYESPPVPSSLNSEIPPTVDRMILRMMAKSPDDRPQDATQLLAELRGLRQSLGQPGGGAQAITPPPGVSGIHGKSSTVAPLPTMQGMPVGSIKALAVDDVPSVRKLYSRVLAEMGFNVLEAGDGEEALEVWRRESPMVILMDLQMPKLGGLEVLERAREEKLAGEIIIITSQKSRDNVRIAAQNGACSYIVKPVNIHELRARVESVMTLPAARVTLSKVMPAENAEAAPIDGSRQIIVLDSSAYAKSLYRGTIENMGHQVACLDSVADVEKILQEDTPDVMLVGVSSAAPQTLDFLKSLAEQNFKAPVITITDERDEEVGKTVAELALGPVLSKPVRLEVLRNAVRTAISSSGPSKRPSLDSVHFSQVMGRQLVQDHAYTVVDFARDLATVLPEGARSSFEQRLQEGSAKEVCAAVTNLMRKLKDESKLDVAMRFLKHAYMYGNVEARNLCLSILPQVLSREEEIDILLKIITDEDFRIRCKAISRLGELNAENEVDIIVRFLNDEVWKVRKAAAECLEKFSFSKVLEPLIVFYARVDEPLPDKIRKRLLDSTGAKEIHLLEHLAVHTNSEVRVFVADFMGQLKSKLTVKILFSLLGDKAATVRAAAANAAGRVQNDKLRDRLFACLMDGNSEVQSAVIGALQAYPITGAASMFLECLGLRGKRISEDAARFVVTLNQSEDVLGQMLANLSRQNDTCRKYLSLFLTSILTGKDELENVVRMLNSGDGSVREQAIHMVVEKIRRSNQELQRRRRVESRGW